MVDLWDVLMMLALVAVVLLFPRISPCVGCAVASDGRTDGACQKDCVAFLSYQKKIGRL